MQFFKSKDETSDTLISQSIIDFMNENAANDSDDNDPQDQYQPIHKPFRIANLISKLNFYKLIPYPMDNSLSGRRRPARQTSEKDVLCLHRPGRSNAVHSPGGVWYFLPV